jgi:integrase
MPRMTQKDPSYRRHKQSGQAIVTVFDGLGGRRDHLLGPYGSPGSKAKYHRILAEWNTRGRALSIPADPRAETTVNELILAFWPHAEKHYRRPDGSPSNELNDFRLSLLPLKRLYGDTPVAQFGPLALKAVRQAMVEGSWLTDKEKAKRLKLGQKLQYCRGVVNQRVGRIRRMYRWGVENELVAPSVLQGLQAVRGLAKGRSSVRETEPIKPVPQAFVDATLPYMLPPVAAMVRIQLLTGMRPGEAVVMRAIDLDMAGKVWLYRPGSDQGPHGAHKTAYRGHGKIVAIGPKAQEIITPFLRPELTAFLFSPRDALADMRVEQRAKRKTKVQPSQQNRRKKSPKVKEWYTVKIYGQAIARAVEKADRAAHEADKSIPADHVIVPHWHPHQLRHNAATAIRKEFGLDVARAILGHRSPQITELYAELDVGRAVQVMEKLG